jgi:DNA invertase Pin-like site-specific DNA recombinase
MEEACELFGGGFSGIAPVAALLLFGQKADGHGRFAELSSFATAGHLSEFAGLLVLQNSVAKGKNFATSFATDAPMLIGYARVSTEDQNLTQQRAALQAARCRRIYEEKISGAKRDRPQLARLIDQLRPDDVVTVTRLDRLARSTRDLLDIAERLQEAGAGLRSLAEPWADTTSPAGRMVLTVFAGIAEFERALISERTSTGRIAAKARGVRFGRPPKLTADQIALAQRLISEGRSSRDAAKILNVHASTLYRAFALQERAAPAADPVPM